MEKDSPTLSNKSDDGDESQKKSSNNKQVRFDPDSANNSKENNNTMSAKELRKAAQARQREKLNQQARAVKRVKMGDGKANLLRDGLIFLIVVVGIFYVALQSELGQMEERKHQKQQTVSKKKEHSSMRVAVADRLNKMMGNFHKLMLERMEGDRRKDDCALFLAGSSIPSPSHQHGMFAGKSYGTGDAVLETSYFISLTDLLGHNIDNKQQSVSALALLFKFHPTLGNIQGTVLINDNETDIDVVFRTTRPIKPGEEFLLPYESHLAHLLSGYEDARSLFSHIPTLSDYEKVDEIARNIKAKARKMEVVHARRPKDPIRDLNTETLYVLGQEIAQTFSPIVASMVPTSSKQFKERKMDKVPSSESALAHRALSNLQISGFCFSDVTWPTYISQHDQHAVATAAKQFEPGAGVQLIPVHIVWRSALSTTATASDSCQKEQECRVDYRASLKDHCLSPPDSLVAVCPLTGFRFVGADAAVDVGRSANIELHWHTRRGEKVSIESLNAEQLRSFPPATFALSVVATKTIDIGDPLILADVGKTANKLVHKKWRI